MKKFIVNPIFGLGLFLRLALIFLIVAPSASEWYVPFLSATASQWSADPWQAWLASGGSPVAFPYGYVMWLVFLPLTLLATWLGFPVILAHGMTLLLADLSMIGLLRKLLPGRDRLLLWAYWLSPLVILPTYCLGLNDLIPVLLLTLSLNLLRQLRLAHAGAACVAAVSAKFSMLLALPFFAIYLLHNRPLRPLVPSFLKGAGLAALLFLLPFAFSDSGVTMLFGNPEMGKVYLFAFDLGSSLSIYIVPLVYMVSLYAAWRVRRLNYDLFQALLGLFFLLIVLMTPASPGWFLWTVPLLVSYQAMSDRTASLLIALFSAVYTCSTLLGTTLETTVFGGLELLSGWKHERPELMHHIASLLHTALVAAGVVLALRIVRETIRRNDYFRLSRRPFVIGVSGDSGAGKDTFSDAIKGLFGAHSVTTLSGDDYHLWDRQKPMWQVMTHLNPMANDLERFASDLVALTDGKSIQSRHYDHATGKMSRAFRIESNDFIIASGLHALYLPILRECYNLSIYLDIDERLRRHFKLQRDVHQRGHTVERVMASFDRREPDSARFIRPQAEYADLVLSLQPIHPRMLDEVDERHPLRFKLVARSRHGLNELLLRRVLVGVCGLHVDVITRNDAGEVELVIEGETSAQDMALAAQMVCPRILEFLDIQPDWKDGMAGLMQLIALSHVNQALMKRFIW